jgi:hypothetical protein
MVVRPSGHSPADCQRLLPRGSALVLYAPCSRSLYSLVVTGNGNSVQVSPAARGPLLEQVIAFWSLLNRRVMLEDSSADLQKSADRRLQDLSTALYPPFFRPVEGVAGSVQDLFVVLPREFGLLPLQALRRGSTGAMRRFAGEQVTIHYLPAAASLMLPAPPLQAGHEVTGLGHPGTTGWDVEYELRDIRAFYKDATLIFDRQATFGALKQAGGDILHATAELRYGTRSPGNAIVLLSDGKTADGTSATSWGLLPEVAPHTGVVLSDLGPHVAAKNPALAQLLLMGGTRMAVLHSFTPLRRSRKTFGEGFYTALLAGAQVDGAFHQAQLQLIGDSRGGIHHWAAFSLWGR